VRQYSRWSRSAIHRHAQSVRRQRRTTTCPASWQCEPTW
jgi:hypothetical protein